jgi:hypothetical protein
MTPEPHPAEVPAIDRSHMYSAAVLRVPAGDLARMAALVTAVERVVALPAWQDYALALAPQSARVASAARGVFFGYDFHLGPAGPQLIEINTNAGGALLCARQAADSKAEGAYVAMFREEWRRCRGDAPLTRIAIVDENPAAQFLYPEFLAFQQLFVAQGIDAVICAPDALAVREGALYGEGQRIDLVYNRLTDFALDAPGHVALRQAWDNDLAVITPHPRAHALYADKRHLVTLSDDAQLAAWGIDAATRAVLAACVPHTELVTPERADDLHARRRQLFFKPAGGFGSKAAYRGASITRRVFDEALAGNYIAQALVPPSTCPVDVDGATVELKADLRNYSYAGNVQLVAARLWQGQTTNFRTPGGGFARVVSAGDASTA